MKRILLPVLGVMVLASCSDKSASESAGEASKGQEIVLETAADTLGYYLAEALVDVVRENLDSVPADQMQDFDSEKFNTAVSAMLNSCHAQIGYYYGALHGAYIYDQIYNFRSAGVNVNLKQFVSGFSKGMSAGKMSQRDSLALNELMVPVNNKLIIYKRNTSKNNNFRRPDGTVYTPR